MSQFIIIIILLLLLLLARVPPLFSLPSFPDPDPAAIQPNLLFPFASSPPATIPAFPEQSADAAAASCSLDLSPSLLRAVSHSCSSNSGLPSRSRCCPSLAAWLLSAYAPTALRAPPAQPLSDLPVLPDDSETCADSAEAAIRARGVDLPWVNGTCGVAYCYCGVRLRPLSCPAAFTADTATGRWVPMAAPRRLMERDCKRGRIAGCSRCLRTLNQLNSFGGGRNTTGSVKKPAKSHANPDDRECQMMGLTWLLSKNRSVYLSAAAAVLRTFLASAPGAAPASCYLSSDDLPFAVDSAQLDSSISSAPPVSSSSWSSLVHLMMTVVLPLGSVLAC